MPRRTWAIKTQPQLRTFSYLFKPFTILINHLRDKTEIDNKAEVHQTCHSSIGIPNHLRLQHDPSNWMRSTSAGAWGSEASSESPLVGMSHPVCSGEEHSPGRRDKGPRGLLSRSAVSAFVCVRPFFVFLLWVFFASIFRRVDCGSMCGGSDIFVCDTFFVVGVLVGFLFSRMQFVSFSMLREVFSMF